MAGDSLRETVSNLTESLGSYFESGIATHNAVVDSHLLQQGNASLTSSLASAAGAPTQAPAPAALTLLTPLSDYYQRTAAGAAPTEAGTNLVGLLSSAGTQLAASSMSLASTDALKGK